LKINIFLSEEEKANAMAALEEVLNDLSNGVLVDFRMTQYVASSTPFIAIAPI
jgi:hypothetical protein